MLFLNLGTSKVLKIHYQTDDKVVLRRHPRTGSGMFYSMLILPFPHSSIPHIQFWELLTAFSNGYNKITFSHNSWVIFHCVYVPQLCYPFICQWTPRLLPCPSYCKQCCDEHWGACVSFNSGFLGCMPNSGISGLYHSSISSFLRNLHTVLHSGCVPLDGSCCICKTGCYQHPSS